MHGHLSLGMCAWACFFFFLLLFKREDYLSLSSASFYLYLSKYADDTLPTKVEKQVVS